MLTDVGGGHKIHRTGRKSKGRGGAVALAEHNKRALQEFSALRVDR